MDTASSHAPAGVMLPESGARAITSPIGQPIDPETARGTTLAFSNLLSTCKAQVGNLSGRDLLRRDYKEVSVQDAAGAASVAGAEGAPFKLGVSSVPVGLASWLRKDQPISAEPEETWYHFWHTLDEWMAERGIQLAVVLNSFRGQKEGDEDNSKRRRELCVSVSMLLCQERESGSISDLVPFILSPPAESSLSLRLPSSRAPQPQLSGNGCYTVSRAIPGHQVSKPASCLKSHGKVPDWQVQARRNAYMGSIRMGCASLCRCQMRAGAVAQAETGQQDMRQSTNRPTQRRIEKWYYRLC